MPHNDTAPSDCVLDRLAVPSDVQGVLIALALEHETPRQSIPSVLTAENYDRATGSSVVTTPQWAERGGRSERHSVRYKARLRGDGGLRAGSRLWDETIANATGNHSVLTGYAEDRLERYGDRYAAAVTGYRVLNDRSLLGEGDVQDALNGLDVSTEMEDRFQNLDPIQAVVAAGFTRSAREALFVASLTTRNPKAFWLLGQLFLNLDPHTGVAALNRATLQKDLKITNDKSLLPSLRRSFDRQGWGSAVISGDDVVITPSSASCAARAAWEVAAAI